MFKENSQLKGIRNSLKRMELIFPALQSLCLVSVSFAIKAGLINRERDSGPERTLLWFGCWQGFALGLKKFLYTFYSVWK